MTKKLKRPRKTVKSRKRGPKEERLVIAPDRLGEVIDRLLTTRKSTKK